MKLGLVPLSDKDSEKIKKSLNTSPEFEKLIECIESEMEFSLHSVGKQLVGLATVGITPDSEARLSALRVANLGSTLEILKEFLEPDYKLHTLDIDK